ncbi:hypothetical protein QFC19_004177 [Naganishia cerealis]|uniref:Uncharacterized protein n=1 Tax=Naganishia cerealis TaxID=610337 RepID=A0ACC2VY87_9TREE|nr:hypothetical protein QFC19_004177 [Naganishia cerealis]
MSTLAHSQSLDHSLTPDSESLKGKSGYVVNTLAQDAQEATDKEQKMSLREGIRLYPRAIMWSETSVSSQSHLMAQCFATYRDILDAFPQFNKRFGVLGPDGTYQVPARWQSGLSNAANCGEILGLALNGLITERLGYKKVVLGSLLLLACLVAVSVTATRVEQLLVYYLIAGIPWGIFQTLTITYASEVMPVALRQYLTTYVNFCWGLGQVIGVGVVKSQLGRTDNLAWQLPYYLQLMWPPILGGLIFFAPESPWWLVRHGKYEEAKKSLYRLTDPKQRDDFDADQSIAMMKHTIEMETQITAGASYLDCFRGSNLRRTEITCMVWAIQNLSGNSFTGYSTYFFQQAGLSTESSFSFALGQYGINMLGVFGAWFLMSRGIGRRSLYFYGLCGLFVMLLAIGFLSLAPASAATSTAYATGGLMLGWACIYQCTVGTVAYSLVGEIPSRRLLIKSVALGRNAYNIVGIACSVLTPYMVNPTAWNWSKKTAFFWAGACFLCIIYTYFRIPEPRGRSFAELDYLFENRISARKFASTEVDVFHSELSNRAVARAMEESKDLPVHVEERA